MPPIRTSTAVAVILALAPVYAHAAGGWSFSDVDADGNLELSESEFERVSQATFQAWNQGADERISSNELYAGLFSAWDSNDNGQLDETEYRNGFAGWFDSNVNPPFDQISGDDSAIGEEEFTSALRGSDQMAGFETGEQGLDWQAFHVALYDVYDRDNDERVGQQDFAEFQNTQLTNVATDEQTAAVSADAQQINASVAPADWDMSRFYADGMSVDYMIDASEVYGVNGDEIGSVENIVFAEDGEVLSLVAEVGGFWDLFDTHVNVPWDEVEHEDGRITIPVTEESVGNYEYGETDYLWARNAESLQEVDDDLKTGPRAFRATDLIGDFVRIQDGDAFNDYGYVNDLIIQDGTLQTVVVRPNAAYGRADAYGYGYPYYGWRAGSPYYHIPYEADAVAEAEAVEFERFGYE